MSILRTERTGFEARGPQATFLQRRQGAEKGQQDTQQDRQPARMAQPRARLFRGKEEAAPGARQLLWDHLQRVPAGKQRCFVREGYRLNPQQFPQAPSSWLICQTGCFPDRVRMLNSQTSVIFFLFWSDQKNGGGGWGMEDGAGVDKGVKS